VVHIMNFTNLLRAAFTRTDPKSAKKYSQTVFFALLGPARVKAALQTLAKFDNCSQFHQR